MSKTKLPWFKFEPQVWLSDRDVLKLTPAQRGCYIDLLSHDWITRGIPEDPAEAVRLLTGGAKIQDVAVVLKLFKVKIEGDLVTHKRNESQRDAFTARSEVRRDAAKARWEDAQAVQVHPKSACKKDANASYLHGEKFEDGVRLHPPSRARAHAKNKDEEEDEDKPNLSLERDARSERGKVRDVNHDWLRRELSALPAAWSPELRAKWSEWLTYLIEREQQRHPAKDPVLCRPTTSTLDAHRRTLAPLPDDAARVAWLETAIGARLLRPAEPTTRGGAAVPRKPLTQAHHDSRADF